MLGPVHHQQVLHLQSGGPGLTEFTRQVEAVVASAGIGLGTATLFVRHTSASLVIQENDDPDVPRDLEAFLRRLVPEGR
jgi:secondary thiamine-phosphate synthase enzyme